MNSELIKKVEQWFIDRNLHTGDPLKQWEKLVEEFGELVKGKNKNDIEMIKDSIGDMLVVMIGIGLQIDYPFALRDKGKARFNPKFIYELSKLLPSLYMNLDWLLERTAEYDLPENLENYKEHVSYDMKFISIELKRVCSYYNTSLDECLQLAYDEIKDRKGKLIDGVFVKESDL